MRRLALALLLATSAAPPAAAAPVAGHPDAAQELAALLQAGPGAGPGAGDRPAGTGAGHGQASPFQQTLVLPQRPGQNQVAWYDFEWQYVDLPAPDGGRGGLRLYHYRSAAAQARRALPAIRSAYARLVAEFAYSPSRRIPFILYGTQREFQTSNVFEVSESVLGVTSPRDLKMSVPYFGDHARFLEVATHEMVHQFTIQKLLDAAGGDPTTSAIQRLPLWFIEGIAEYYTRGGLDDETDGYLRDLVWNPDPARRHQVVAFAEDRLRGYLPTYKLGQARVAFVAEAYGREKIQALMEHADLLPGQVLGADGKGFDALARRVLGEPIEQVDARWRAWLKRRYFPAYGAVRQDLAQVRQVRGLPAEPEALVASPDGQALLVRGLDREKGRARLYLADLRNVAAAATVVSDDTPGSESLHPLDYGVAAIAEGVLAWSAQAGAGDVLTVQRWRREQQGKLPRLRLGDRRRLEVLAPGGGGFVRIADPCFSPDASALAFVGTAADGQQDVYVVPVGGGAARRLTDDFFAERDLAWGPDGLYLSSDATDHGRFNLFRLDPVSGDRTRLTTWPAEDRHPRPLPGGRLVFSTTGHGKVDLAELADGAVRPLTDFTTALTWPAAAPPGRGLLAVTFHGGVFRLLEVPRLALLAGPATPVAPPAGEVLPIPAVDLPATPVAYRRLAPGNWRLENGIVYGAGAAGGVAGRAALVFADDLRDQGLVLDLAVLGDWEVTQGRLLYVNRARRVAWMVGASHLVNAQVDRQVADLEFIQRELGLVGLLSFPFDRFRRLEAELTLGFTERYCPTDFGFQDVVPCAGLLGDPAGTAAWRAANGGLQPTIAPALRLGHDTVRHDPFTGPLSGQSALLELGGGWLPGKRAVHGSLRTELAGWLQLSGRANLMLRLAGATTFALDEAGRRWQRTWWVSSADNLRGYLPFDTDFLVGRNYLVTNLELQLPLDWLVRLPILDQLEGVAALDFGGVFDRATSRPAASLPGEPCRYATTRAPQACLEPGAWDSRTLTGVLGVNLVLGPILLRLHWGHPFDVGGLRTPALRSGDRWVTNFTLRYAFF